MKLPDPVQKLHVLGRLVRRKTKRPGAAPGTLVHVGDRKMDEVRLTVLDYDRDVLDEGEPTDVTDLASLRDSETVSWINVDGLHDVELVQRIGEHFGIHPLVLEDIVATGQRPKLEEYDGHLYVVLSMLSWDAGTRQLRDEQLSLVLGPRWVLTFQEREGDAFEPVRDRLRQGRGQIRRRGADYLAYALVDAVVDSYFHVLEEIGAETEALELEVLDDPSRDTMSRLHHLKREMIMVRRAVWPVRDLTNGLVRSESELIEVPTKVFIRDVYDHAIQIIDGVEALRDVLSGMIDLYLSNVSHRTNEVMKVLTIMASIFIPLTFMAGVYGMNFEHMPELGLPWAYPVLLGLMILIAGGMIAYFRRRGWL